MGFRVPTKLHSPGQHIRRQVPRKQRPGARWRLCYLHPERSITLHPERLTALPSRGGGDPAGYHVIASQQDRHPSNFEIRPLRMGRMMRDDTGDT